MNRNSLAKDSDKKSLQAKSPDHPEHSDKPSKWWQWLLMYPTALIALIGAIPPSWEFYKSWDKGIPFGTSQIASEENKLWKKNFECSKGEFFSIKNAFNIEVGTIICRSGDILLKIQAPGKGPIYRWVGLDSLTSEKLTLDYLFINQAYANSELAPIILAQYNSVVICQRWINAWRLIRRVSIQGQGCFDEIVDTYTGRIEQRNSAPCNKQC
ncbi:MAG: hypothetical protein U1F42_03555 [Candidatus Competibacteraceae bacterium]